MKGDDFTIYLSKQLTASLINEKIIYSEERELYEYGFQITLANIINSLIVCLIGIVMSAIKEVVVFYFVFVILRNYCGGYHANSYKKCFITFGCICLSCVITGKMLTVLQMPMVLIILAIIQIILGNCIFFLAPMEDQNRKITNAEKGKLKKKCWICYSLVIVCSAFLSFAKLCSMIAIMIPTVFCICGLMIIKSMIERRKQYEENVKNACENCKKSCKKSGW